MLRASNDCVLLGSICSPPHSRLMVRIHQG